jgi:methylglutaconyl-CoA hydratase
MGAFEHIKVDRLPELRGVSRVTLARPQVGNAMSDQTLRELSGAFHVLSADPKLRAVVVMGEGKHFCAGADIEWMKRAGALPAEEGKKDARLLVDMLSAVQQCPVPVIVAAHGAVYGGGLGLLAACDIALVADDAKFCFSETKLGIMPAVISCFVLPKIGVANARRYYPTAEVFDAGRAKELGLAHEIAPVGSLAARAAALAESIGKNSPQAVRAAKELVLKFDRWTPEQRVDNVIETLVRLRSSPEGQEGLSAFLEKRPAAWTKPG